jgi:hypothetical protein
MLSREKRQEMVNQLREMMGEETEMVRPDSIPVEELAEDTPHFLNPEVLRKEVDFAAEEDVEPLEEPSREEDRDEPAGQSAEQMEQVLNQGMGFISGLLEMATGKKLGVAEGSEKMVTLDKKTGEVTLKFTLPGFTKSM